VATTLPDRRLPFVRLLHRDLDLAAYFDEADRAIKRCVPFDASCWMSLDPGSFLPTGHFSREYGADHLLELVANEYLEDDVNKFADLAAAPHPVGILSRATNGDPSRSPRHRFLASHGFGDGDELRAVFKDGEAVWGAVAIHRRDRTFTERDADAIADLGGPLASGIRRAILGTALAADREVEQPGLIVLRPDGSLESLTPAARVWLGELVDSTAASGRVPLTVVSVAEQARLAAAGLTHEPATVRLPRRSGGWLRLDASLLDAQEDGRVAVIVSAAHDPELAGVIARLYGLSAREREVARLVLQGRSTLAMAEALHVTRWTVQDHLKAIFNKAGVRSRGELVAQLFHQQCAPRLAHGASPGVDGWFTESQATEVRVTNDGDRGDRTDVAVRPQPPGCGQDALSEVR
jgi:DNA-binding CsgD family transcriptional regulator